SKKSHKRARNPPCPFAGELYRRCFHSQSFLLPLSLSLSPSSLCMNGGREKRTISGLGRGTSVKTMKLTLSDRISDLPDDLLRQILSKLSTKESVSTSVLSKRWRYFWKHVPALDLDSSKFTDQWYLEGFFDRFLEADEYLKIKRFKWIYNAEEHCHSSFVSRIDHVVNRGVCNLSILSKVNTEDESVQMPLSLYSCATLVNLTLYGVDFNALESELVSLPCLKTMHLEAVMFHGASILETLISSCSVLDELVIVTRHDDYLGVVCVHSPSLRRFKLESMREKGGDPDFEIDAPKLEYMSITNYQFERFIMHRISSSAKVNIDVVYEFDVEDDDPMIHNIITAISKVRELTISARTLKMFHDHSGLEPLPQFSNLSCLHASLSESFWEMFPTFLGCFPNLHSLSLEFDCLPETGEKELSFVPQCFQSSLKIVQLKIPITGTETSSKMQLAKYFISKCVVLKKLTLNESFGNVINNISNIPKLAKGCEVVMLKPAYEDVSHGSIMAAPRNLTGDGGGRQLVKEEESAAASSAAKGLLNDDSPTGKRTKSERFPLPRWEFAVFFTVFLVSPRAFVYLPHHGCR
ncbi:unnamed protein product, partial [Arabidopsis halleri]